MLACATLSCDGDGLGDRPDAAEPAAADAESPASQGPLGTDAAVSQVADAAPVPGAMDREAGAMAVEAGRKDAGPIGHEASVDATADAAQGPRPMEVPPPAICPTPLGLAAGNHRQMLQHEGRMRSYLVHVPSGADATKRLPLVLDFHGYSRSASSQQSGSGWERVADREGIVVAYPEGVSSSWNVGGCCGGAGTSNVDDVGFARALITKLATQLCLDTTRVYASGVSNGAGMSGRLGCEAADVIAGVALVSSDLRTKPCTPARPVTEIAFRGTADTLEPYEGGLVGPPGMQFESPGARGSFELWKNVNQCSGTPAMTVKLCETYSQCASSVEVTLCTLPGVGHSPYQNELDFDIAQVSWDAFQRAPRR